MENFQTPVVRILHLEDNASDAALIKALVEEARSELSASVEWVSTKEAYGVALQSGTYDVILSDYRMADFDGDQALKAARKLCPDIPFIMVTGELGEERAIETLKEGATDYVLKDRPQRLVPAILRALKEAALVRDRRENEKQYQTIVETAAEGIVLEQPDGPFTFVNRRMADMLGYTVEEMLGKSRTDFAWDPASPQVTPARGGLRPGNAINGEFKFRRRDGSVLWTMYNTTPIFTEPEKHAANLVMHTDITARKQAEETLQRAHDELELRVEQRTAALKQTGEALQAERQRFIAVLDVLPAYVVLLTADYRVQFANRFFEERFGKSLGRRCYEYLFNRSEPCEVCETYEVMKDWSPRRWEWTGPDGCVYDIYDFPFTDTDGSRLILEMGLDITGRKRAEAELEQYRHHLEDLVRDRTSQLSTANEQLQQEIAEHRQAQEALRLSEEKFAIAFANNPAVITLTRLHDGVYLDVNDTWVALTGYSRGEALGRSAREMGIWPNKDDIIRFVHELREKGVVHRWEQEFVKKSGEHFLTELSSQVLTIAGEEIVLSTMVDITARKMVEQALRRSEEWYRTLFDTMLEGFCTIEVIFDAGNRPVDYRFLDVNPAFERQTGLREAQGKLMRELAPDHEAYWFEIYGKIALTGEPARFENEARALHRWYEVSAFRVGAPGERKVAILFNDITERKQAEVALKASEENLRLMVSQATDAMIVLDSGGVIEAVSASGAHLLGYDERELVGRQAAEFAVTFSRLEALLTIEDLRRRAPLAKTVSARVKTKGRGLQLMCLTVSMINLGTRPEKYFVKFSKVELPSPLNKPSV